MAFVFQKATKAQRKARIGIVGPSGSGKTYTALTIAAGLAGPGGRIALIDTENASASLYADRFEFDTLQLDTFSPKIYVQAIRAAEAAGYDVVIIDSLSHAWAGKDGALEQVDKAAARSGGNSFAAWRHVTPMHNELVDAIVRCKAHVIATMRAKTEYVVDRDEKTGKTVPRKVGLAPVQRDGMEYEFDIVADMDLENRFIVSKSRMESLSGEVITKPTAELGDQIRAWLTDGAPETPQQPTAPQTEPVQLQQPQATPAQSQRKAQANGNGNGNGININNLMATARDIGWTNKELLQAAAQVRADGQASLSGLSPEEYKRLEDMVMGVPADDAPKIQDKKVSESRADTTLF